MISVALAVLAVLLVLGAGGFPRATPVATVLGRGAGGLVVGAVLLHLGLTLFDRIGVGWRTVPVLLLALALALLWAAGRRESRREKLPKPGWGLLVAAVPVTLYGIFAAQGLSQATDFIYHWGLKARRWAVAGGVDETLFARPDSWRIHTDYPRLFPELLGLPGFLTGRFDERAALLLSVAVAALTVLALRFVLRSHGVTAFELEAATAIAGCAVAGFGLIYGMAGNADGLLALALLAGVAGLLRLGEPAGQATVGWSAALAAATKIEGVPLAGLLVGTALGLRWRERHSRSGGNAPGELVRLAVPGVLVVLPWWLENRGRFVPTNFGGPRWAELGNIFSRLAHSALEFGGGFWPLALLLLPWVARSRRLRAAAALVGAQLLVYLTLYLVSPVDLRLLIATSGTRLLSHLVPAALLLSVLRAKTSVYAGSPEGPAPEPSRAES